jgi:DNA topoisomerase-6 subunit B
MPRRAERPAPTAAELATRQRDISVAEFFLENRHLLGFDSPQKALLTAVKEAVDNALDACEEAQILPEVRVEVRPVDDGVLRVAIEDNGPGIVEAQIGKIFGKLLYGSRFHKLSQSRGQQGLGISAAGMYAQLTTGKPLSIRTRVVGEPAHELSVGIDTSRNRPDIHDKRQVDWSVAHGTRVEIELEARERAGAHSVERYLRLTSIANPHVTLHLVDAAGNATTFVRTTNELPPQPDEIKPHPDGLELGRLVALLKSTDERHLGAFLQNELSRVGSKTAQRIIARADHGLTARSYPRRVARRQASALYRALHATKVSAPVASCVVPIGEARLLASLERESHADFCVVVCRPPAVYRGNPFVVEVGLAYGGSTDADGLTSSASEPVTLLRFANRVPLLFQQSACAMTRAVIDTGWRSYGLTHPKGALPLGPMLILLHVASVWVPFTSESKEAVASYPEIARELALALRACGRKLRAHLARSERLSRAEDRRERIRRYVPHVVTALTELLALDALYAERLTTELSEALELPREGESR